MVEQRGPAKLRADRERWNRVKPQCVFGFHMPQFSDESFHDGTWLREQVERSVDEWNGISTRICDEGPRYSTKDQEQREHAYDQALDDVEREARSAGRTRPERLAVQDRILACFGRFAAVALGLEPAAVELLNGAFLPLGAQFAQRARRFDANLPNEDIIQACRNAWTVCGLQPLLGEPMRLTPPVIGYSLLYPYSDNYLDARDVLTREKLRFLHRFRERLAGRVLPPLNRREKAIWELVAMIESQFRRDVFPQVYDSLLAIHQAQEHSIAQLKGQRHCDDATVLRISCAKGGTSVLADACLCRGWVDREEGEFAFDWGFLLQLGDDLQDLRGDVKLGSQTLFTREAAARRPVDSLTARLLNLSDRISQRMERMPNGSAALKGLLRMSWRSLIVMAVAEAHDYCTPAFTAEMERHSPFRFNFLRARQKQLTRRRGLYANLFDIFLEPREAGSEVSCNFAEAATANT